MAMGAPIAGWFADRSSSRQAPFLVGLVLASSATLVFCFARAPWLLVGARAFQGISASIIYTAGPALIDDTVAPDEVGSWMGFMLSGMNLAVRVAPLLAGLVYDRAGYYAVLTKKTARRWQNPYKSTVEETNPPVEEPSPISQQRAGSSTSSASSGEPRVQESSDAESTLAATLLLDSPRIQGAVYGCFTHRPLVSSFDAVLPLFGERMFGYLSTGAGLTFFAITIPSTLSTVIGALSDRYGTRAVSLFGFALTTLALALMGLATEESVGDQAPLIVLLVANGIGLNFILAPLAVDMFDEVESLAARNPDSFDPRGDYAQAYSLFDAALGVATIVAPAWSGFFFERTNWQLTAGTLAPLCAAGGIPVLLHAGNGTSKAGKGKRTEKYGDEVDDASWCNNENDG